MGKKEVTPLVVEQFAVVSAEQGLNLRQGPSTAFPILTVLDDGDEVQILSLPFQVEVPHWALVCCICGDTFGWVKREFLVDIPLMDDEQIDVISSESAPELVSAPSEAAV